MSRRRDGMSLLGVGALACAACCAGPVLGVVAAVGIGTLAAVFGLAVLVLVLPAAVLLRRRRTCAPAAVVAVEAPVRR